MKEKIFFGLLFVIVVSAILFKLSGYYVMFGFGDSMNLGRVLILEKTSSCNINDICVYKFNKDYVVHRVHKFYNYYGIKTYIFKGDNNKKIDPVVREPQIKYKVIFYFL